jgi:uncharacterized protein YegL
MTREKLGAVIFVVLMLGSVTLGPVGTGLAAKTGHSPLQTAGNSSEDEVSTTDTSTERIRSIAREHVSDYSSSALSDIQVVESADGIAGADDVETAISAPTVTGQSSGTATVTLYGWAADSGLLTRWELTVDTSAETVAERTATVVERDVGSRTPHEGYSPPVGAVVVNDELSTPGVRSSAHTGADISFSNNYVAFDGQGNVNDTTITLENWEPNTQVTLTITVDGNRVQNRSGQLTFQTDGNGDGSVRFVPAGTGDTVYTGQATIEAQSASRSDTWAITDPNPTDDNNPDDDERGLLTIEEIERFDATAGGQTVTFRVHYTDQFAGANGEQVHDAVGDAMVNAYETIVGTWGFDAHLGDEYDVDDTVPVYINNGVDFYHNSPPGTVAYGISPRGSDDQRVRIGYNTNFPVQGFDSLADADHLLAHETFHTIQYAYNGFRPFNRGTNDWYQEGSARFIETLIDADRVHDPQRLFYEDDVNGVNNMVDSPQTGLEGRSYDYALVWAEIYQDNGQMATIERIFEEIDNVGPNAAVDGPEAITDVLRQRNGEHDSFQGVIRDFHVDLLRATRGGQTGIYQWNGKDWGEYLDTPPVTQVTYQGSQITRQPSTGAWGADYTSVAAGNSLGTDDAYYVGTTNDVFRQVGLTTASGDTVRRAPAVVNTSADAAADYAQQRAGASTTSGSVLTVPPVVSNNTVPNAEQVGSIIVTSPSDPQDAEQQANNYDLEVTPVESDNRFSGSLSADENATYVIPVNQYGQPGPLSVFEHNGDVFATVWETGSSDVSATLSTTNGRSADQLPMPSGSGAVELLGENSLTTSAVWRLNVSSTSPASFSVATNYAEGALDTDQVFTLPSDTEVAQNNRNLQAGSNNSPQPIQFTVTVSTAGRPYTSGPFDEPDESNFDISIGGQQPSSVNIARHTQNEYRLVVSPPTQPSNGQYDLDVSFTDEKFGVSETATTTLPDAVSYSGSGASGATSVSLVLDSSGSMGGSKIQNARQAANQFLNPFSADDRVSIIRYDSSSSVAYPMSLFGGNESDIRSAIDNTGAFGGTNIGAGLQDARGQLDQAPDQTSQAAVLLTDGNNNVGFSDSGVVSIASTFASRGYCVYTVAFGGGADRPLLRDIASQSCGTFNDAATGADLRAVYRDISSTTSGLVTINTNTGTVAPSTTVTNSVSFDDSTDSSVISVTTGTSASSPAQSSTQPATTGPTSVRLSYPNGTQVQLNSSTSSGTENPQIFYTASADTETYRIENPQAGQWTYDIVNNGSSSTSYEAEISGSTGTTVTVVTDGQTYTNGSDAELSAVLAGQNGSVSGATVDATIETPNGNTSSVTLTEAQAGRYTGSVELSQSGQYNATVEVSSNNVQREETLTWSVVDQSSLVAVDETDNESAAPGGQASVTLNVSRPSSSTGSPVTSQSSATDFDSAAREVARGSPDEIRDANVSEAVREAARRIRNGSTSDSSGATATSGAVGSNAGLGVYVQTTALTDGNGNTIPAANVQANLGVFSLRAGDARALQISVDVPQDAPKGVYNGTVTLLVQGTQIEVPISVEVTEAGAAVYRARIVELTQQWRNASPSGRTYHEGRIADQLTSIYFTTNETNRVRAADADATFASAQRRWQGQSLFLKDSGAANATYELREADATANGAVPGSSVTNITLDSSGEAIVDRAVTGTLDGEYVLVDESGDVLEFDSDGIAIDTVDPSAEPQVASAAVDLSVQRLDAQLESPVVFQTPVNTTFSSNRGAYNLTVSADSLSAQTLETVFNESFAPTVNTGDGDITIQVTSQVQTESINFSSVARGDYTLEFDVEDSTANTSTSVTVRRPPQTLTSGTTHTQGRLITFRANASAAGATYQLREADNTTSGWQVGAQVREVTLSSQAVGEFATATLDGDYVILDASGQPVVFNGTGVANGSGTVADARFEIVPGSGTTGSPAFASGVRP